jgi:hypothetical protein
MFCQKITFTMLQVQKYIQHKMFHWSVPSASCKLLLVLCELTSLKNLVKFLQRSNLHTQFRKINRKMLATIVIIIDRGESYK